jgi:hypothetical protein
MWFSALFGCGFPIKKVFVFVSQGSQTEKRGIVPDACRALGRLPKRMRIMEAIEFMYTVQLYHYVLISRKKSRKK